MKRFALAGNPNSGKTTLFNSLTGSTAHVGNWPGVTVDKRDGVYKKCEEPIAIVDLPGIYSLSPYTPEEVISRNYILDEKPDCVINIIDATNLERNLYLTTQILEIDVPMVIALNMMDTVEKNGDKIDAKRLQDKIGIPVIEISALREEGLDNLMRVAYEQSKTQRKGRTVLEDTALIHLINDCRIALDGAEVDNSLFHAIKLCELDEIEVAMHPSAARMVEEFKKTFKDDIFGTDFDAIVADARYRHITKHYSPTLTRKHTESESMKKSDKIDRVLTHKWLGIPIFLLIIFMIFHLTFSEDFLFLGVGGAFDKDVLAYDNMGNVVYVDESSFDENFAYYNEDGDRINLEFENGVLSAVESIPYVYDIEQNKVFIDEIVDDKVSFWADIDKKYEVVIVDNDGEKSIEFVSAIDEFLAGVSAHTFFGYEESVYGPGVIFMNLVTTLTDLISVSVNEGLMLAGAPEWVIGLIVDGVLGGLFAVISFLPQILMLFMFFSILEDSGYMARVAFILDKLFRKFGLSGRSFMPMIMGFGCSVPAMINTRTLADQRERTATIRVIPFFSCGAKLPILTAIAGGIMQMTGFGNADLITYGMYVLGIVVAIVAVLMMRSTTLKGETSPFIMELPAYHLPQAKNLALHLWDKAKHFIEKAFTIILASTIVIWFVSHFSFGWQYLPDERINESILAGVGQLIQPLFTPLGFGSQLGASGWVFVVAAITGLIAKENVIATFGTLGACIAGAMIDVEADGGIMAVTAMIEATDINVGGLIAFIAFNMLTIPCFAAVATAKAELRDKKTFNLTLVFWVVTSYVVASMVYTIGTWWWTTFIWLVVVAIALTLVVLNNKGKIDLVVFANKIKSALTPKRRRS